MSRAGIGASALVLAAAGFVRAAGMEAVKDSSRLAPAPGIESLRKAASEMEDAAGGAAVCPVPVSLDCDSTPGVGLCRKLKHLDGLFSEDCRGEECWDRWQRRSRSLDRLFDSYMELPAVEKASRELGGLAKKLARRICSTTMTVGNPASLRYLRRLIGSINDAMLPLRELQKKAGEKKPVYCRFTIG